MNHTRTSIIDTATSTLLVVFGSALAATAVFFAIERDVYIAGFARTVLFIAVPASLAAVAFAPSRRPRAVARCALLLAGSVYGASWITASRCCGPGDG